MSDSNDFISNVISAFKKLKTGNINTIDRIPTNDGEYLEMCNEMKNQYNEMEREKNKEISKLNQELRNSNKNILELNRKLMSNSGSNSSSSNSGGNSGINSGNNNLDRISCDICNKSLLRRNMIRHKERVHNI